MEEDVRFDSASRGLVRFTASTDFRTEIYAKRSTKKDPDEVYSKLKEFYDERRNNDRIVTVNMLYYVM